MDFKDLKVGDCAYYVTTELIYKCKIVSLSLTRNETELDVTLIDPWGTRFAENVDKTNPCKINGRMIFSDRDAAISKQRELRYKALQECYQKVEDQLKLYNKKVQEYTSTSYFIQED